MTNHVVESDTELLLIEDAKTVDHHHMVETELLLLEDGKRDDSVFETLEQETEDDGRRDHGLDFVLEVKRVSSLAMPMVIVTVSQYLLQAVSISMAGHLGQISLSGAAIATSFTDVTGFSLLFGMTGALETLCGQACGAGQYKKIGTYTYTSITYLVLVCVPLSLVWTLIEKLLVSTGQDAEISHTAGQYAIWLIPSLFAFAILESLVRCLQTQSLILPMVLSSVITLCLHVPLCWALVFKTDMGSNGAALAYGISYWVDVILLGIYFKYSPTLDKTRTPFSSKEILLSTGEFFRYAIPSGAMTCLEWWSYELLVLFSGLLPNAKLETSVYSICLSIASLHFFIPYSIGAAASTRVSNELGSGDSRAARVVVRAVMVLAVAEVTLAGTIMFCFRHFLGKAYSNDEDVVNYFASIAPYLCLSTIMDTFQSVVSGVTRGSGWQHIGAYINLGVFYLVAIPLALILGFILNMGAKGFWIGMMAGPTLQFILLSLLTSLTDWQKQVIKARERLLEEEITKPI